MRFSRIVGALSGGFFLLGRPDFALGVACDGDEDCTIEGQTCVAVDIPNPNDNADVPSDICATACSGNEDCSDQNGCCGNLGICEDDLEVGSRCTGSCPCPEDTICCPDKKLCEMPPDNNPLDDDPAACGDPHMTGFLGQKFDFMGLDGEWYCLIKDDFIQVSMRVTGPVPSQPEITYITGLSVLITDAEDRDHTIVIEVKDPHSLDSSCPEGVSPCLADGSLTVLLDGEEQLLAPASVTLGEQVVVSAVNLPGACRSFGFDTYWERKKMEYAAVSRRLEDGELNMGEWILGDPTATNMEECAEYVARAAADPGALFAHESEHATFQIVTPETTIRLTHGRLHQIAVRDPTDQFDLPEHTTWQMNMGLHHNAISHTATGVLGETFIPTLDAHGDPIMFGMDAILGDEKDYRVEGPLGVVFAQNNHGI